MRIFFNNVILIMVVLLSLIGLATLVMLLVWSLGNQRFESACLSGESGIICVRQWASVAAIVAGFLTVAVISVQIRSAQRQHTDQMKLQSELASAQSLAVRALISAKLTDELLTVQHKRQSIADKIENTTAEQPHSFFSQFRGGIKDFSVSPYKKQKSLQLDKFDYGHIKEAYELVQKSQYEAMEAINPLLLKDNAEYDANRLESDIGLTRTKVEAFIIACKDLERVLEFYLNCAKNGELVNLANYKNRLDDA